MLAAVAQICSTPVVAENLKACLFLINQAASKGAKAIFFPEASDFIAQNKKQAFELSETLDGIFVTSIQREAAKTNMMVSIVVHERCSNEEKFYNSHLLINDTGKLLHKYRKIHLFDVSLKNGPTLTESATTIAGQEGIFRIMRVGNPIPTALGNIGLGICYDLRFPEFSTLLRKRGAQILTYPSAFTQKTGEAHWDILLRARAIENQCFVIASAQVELASNYRLEIIPQHV